MAVEFEHGCPPDGERSLSFALRLRAYSVMLALVASIHAFYGVGGPDRAWIAKQVWQSLPLFIGEKQRRRGCQSLV
ncbi:hypothetical protein GCM10007276_35990 [Agaricicola taiwanensis]|uniref:Uncharacterized protein n=1 Tax=Agaricicola taiwanensis TaxID=591372 RepID=A0A8J3DZV1_9RHOB|nr:hypothetical protein GCM10007276_35990 [Agaricicola taiwanensis]